MGNDEILKKLESAEGYNADSDVIDKKKLENDKKNKKAMYIAGGAVGVIAISAAFFGLGGGDAVKGFLSPNDTNVSSSVVGGNTTVRGGDAGGQNVQEEGASDISANIPEWSATNIQYAKEDSDLRRQIFASYFNTALRGNTYAMASESSGYHSGGALDDKKVVYTLEDYIASSGEYIERLINPTFGGWSEFQFAKSNAAENFNVDIFSDMFSNKYKEEYAGVPPANYFPVYADWESNNYDMKNLSNSARWHGELRGMESEIFNYGQFNEYTEVNADIVFSSWTEKGEKAEKEGNLYLIIVPGSDGERPLVIDDAVLSVK